MHDWLNTIIAAVTPAVLLWQLAKNARAAVVAAHRAQEAATLASMHAADAAHGVKALQGDLRELAVNTNSITDALVKATAEAAEAVGEKRGIAIGVAQGKGET